ncbi:MAG: DUF5714 domain-containing protein [Armatimonadota bacterium]
MTANWAEHIQELCRTTTSTDPLGIALEAMSAEGFPIAGQAHHGLISGALMAAYQNATGTRDEKLIDAAIQRADSLPQGFCAGFGADVGAIAAGIVVSLIHGNTIKAEHSATRSQAHRMTANCLLAIANNTGNRCCKRTVFQVIETATDFLETNLGVALGRTPVAAFRCPYWEKNPLCNGESCRYFPAQES